MKVRGRINVTFEKGKPLLPFIRGLLPTLRRAQRGIAQNLLRDPEQFVTQPISRVAKICGVSTGSVVHFSKLLGLSGFPTLKIALARELASHVHPLLAEESKRQTDTASLFQQILREHSESLQQTFKLNSPVALAAAAKALLKARRVVIFSIGLSYAVAYSLYARLRFIGLPALVEHDSHMQLAAAAEMTRGDVALAISVSGTTSETVECLRLSRARGAQTICITNSINSPLAHAANIRLYAAPSEVKYFVAPLASRVSQLALADVLLALVARKRRQKSLSHWRRAEEHLIRRRLSVVPPLKSHLKRSPRR